MARKLVRDMTPEEHEEYKKELQAKKEKIRAMTPEERAEFEKKRNRYWSDQYIRKAYATINFRIPKSGKDTLLRFCEEQNITLNGFLRQMVYEGMLKTGFTFNPEDIFPPSVMPEDLKND